MTTLQETSRPAYRYCDSHTLVIPRLTKWLRVWFCRGAFTRALCDDDIWTAGGLKRWHSGAELADWACRAAEPGWSRRLPSGGADLIGTLAERWSRPARDACRVAQPAWSQRLALADHPALSR